jgi:segregation and condensation protein A
MPSALPNDAQGNTAYRVTLPEFEGPLDLLLHLCQTHELDILNISIAFIAEKYIEYLELMQNMSVEVAADYLVMAAHLAYLKSRELVPSPEPLEASEDGEDPIDPREELIRRLLQYQKYKHAAENLGNRPIEGRNVFVRGAVLEPAEEAGLAEHSVWKLLEHWAQILEKAKPQFTHDVVIDRISITDRINQIVDLLETGKGMVRFEDLLGTDLPEAELRHKVVVSLLAVLELARLRVVRILQQVDTGSFFLAQAEGANLADARNLNVTSAKESGHAESEANTAPMVDQSPAEPVATVSVDEAPTVEMPAALPATDETPAAESNAEHAEQETKSAASDTAQLVPQEDVISAPFPASAEGGEEVIDGQTQEEQKATQE